MNESKSILPFMKSSIIPGSSVLPLTPPKADPRHIRPVTNWNGRG